MVRVYAGVALVAIMLAVISAPQAGTAESGPIRGPLLGVHSDLQPDSPSMTKVREIALMRTAGVGWVRLVLNWYVAEPRKGVYDDAYLRALESLIDQVHGAGIHVMLLVLATPPWAAPLGWAAPPQRMEDFGDFVGYAVKRFSPRVRAWELWNEPDWYPFWKPMPDVTGFARMLRAGYTKGKAADPQATFISGGLAGNDVAYLKQLYAAGGGGFFDALGVHPYVFARSPDAMTNDPRHSFSGLADLRAVMVENGDAAKPIWITEMSWSTNARAPSAGPADGQAEGVSEETQADYLTRAYRKIAQEYPFVQIAFWYNLRDKGTNRTLPDDNYGLVRFDFRPKPAFFAMERVAHTATAIQAGPP